MRTIPKERILRVNCPGYGTEAHWNLGRAKSLNNYTAIIVNPTSIAHLFDKDPELVRKIEAATAEGLTSVNIDDDLLLRNLAAEIDSRVLELSDFLTQGGVLIYFLARPFLVQGPNLSLDNYYWLESLAPDGSAERNVRHMSAVSHGRLIEPTEDGMVSEFGPYLQQHGLEWNTLIRTEYLTEGYNVLAEAGAKKCISGQLFIIESNGKVVFLPSPYSPDFDKVLIDCLNRWYQNKEASPEELEAERLEAQALAAAAANVAPQSGPVLFDRDQREYEPVASAQLEGDPAREPAPAVVAPAAPAAAPVDDPFPSPPGGFAVTADRIAESISQEAQRFEAEVAKAQEPQKKLTGTIDLSIFAKTAQQLVEKQKDTASGVMPVVDLSSAAPAETPAPAAAPAAAPPAAAPAAPTSPANMRNLFSMDDDDDDTETEPPQPAAQAPAAAPQEAAPVLPVLQDPSFGGPAAPPPPTPEPVAEVIPEPVPQATPPAPVEEPPAEPPRPAAGKISDLFSDDAEDDMSSPAPEAPAQPALPEPQPQEVKPAEEPAALDIDKLISSVIPTQTEPVALPETSSPRDGDSAVSSNNDENKTTMDLLRELEKAQRTMSAPEAQAPPIPPETDPPPAPSPAALAESGPPRPLLNNLFKRDTDSGVMPTLPAQQAALPQAAQPPAAPPAMAPPPQAPPAMVQPPQPAAPPVAAPAPAAAPQMPNIPPAPAHAAPPPQAPPMPQAPATVPTRNTLGSLTQSNNSNQDLLNFMKEGNNNMTNVNAPDWAKQFSFSYLDELKREQTTLAGQLQDIQAKLNTVESKISSVEQLKCALLAGDGDSLKEACALVLGKLGWGINHSNAAANELLLLNVDQPESLVRLVRSDSHCDRSEVAQVAESAIGFWERHDIEPKGVLIACTWASVSPSQRSQKDFEDPVSEFARKKNLCLMTTLQLIGIYRDLELGLVTQDTVRRQILDTNGCLGGYAVDVPAGMVAARV